jgi:hypothetical protein
MKISSYADRSAEAGRTSLLIVCMALVMMAAAAVSARADMVYGRVYGAEGKFQPKDSFTVKDASGKVVKQVKTDDLKAYSVFLAPGSYIVEYVDNTKGVWKAPLDSYPQAARQDIHLTKR